MARSRTLWLLIAIVAIVDIALLSFCVIMRLDNRRDSDLVFDPKMTSSVALSVGHTQHYNIDEPDTDMEWSKLIPPGGHFVHLNNGTGDVKKHTVAMLHQFKCLDAIRQQYSGPSNAPLSPLTLHCINYLRQSILCNLDIGLESATNKWGTVAKSAEYVCRDWSELYNAVEYNQKSFSQAHTPL
ncbi:hypothetical protein D9619_010304 [Psilocybe cf. subviscida]|uniref:Oxidase ustYa n=1 Tax=Psilocybe cf. subviscida TaxID=2480587 RepID=A0A8H5ASL8_9AGAR|nr:hypothetical protein D9619_010304 [Psilocybe cf. subviscida]